MPERYRKNKKSKSETQTHIHATGQRNEFPAVSPYTQATVTNGPGRELLSEMISSSEPQKDRHHDRPWELLDTKTMTLFLRFDAFNSYLYALPAFVCFFSIKEGQFV